jgi:membrane protein implicated in regulation of membrane protease activity
MDDYTRKRNTYIFLGVASLAMILLTGGLVVGFSALFLLLLAPSLPADAISFGIFSCVILAFIASALIYWGVMRAIGKKVNLDERFHPLFGRRGR